jgi:hypothetical protein
MAKLRLIEHLPSATLLSCEQPQTPQQLPTENQKVPMQETAHLLQRLLSRLRCCQPLLCAIPLSLQRPAVALRSLKP